MTSHRILWVLLVGSVLSCGGDSTSVRTCLHKEVTYAGAKSGAAYLRVTSDNGLYSFAGNAASIQVLILAESSFVSCRRGGAEVDIPLTAVVWIDVSGVAAGVCADVLNPNPECHPSASDPQGHQTALMRFGETTIMHIDVVDPP